MVKDWVSETSEIKLLVSTLVKVYNNPFTIPIPFLTLIPTFGKRFRHVVLFVKKRKTRYSLRRRRRDQRTAA
jgi:hypothetical protein